MKFFLLTYMLFFCSIYPHEVIVGDKEPVKSKLIKEENLTEEEKNQIIEELYNECIQLCREITIDKYIEQLKKMGLKPTADEIAFLSGNLDCIKRCRLQM